MIYFDNNSTTPLHPLVKEAIQETLKVYGNPSNLHKEARRSKEAIERSREIIASFLGAESRELIFTASGSEGNNIVLNSVQSLYEGEGAPHVISSSIEHPCVLESSKKHDTTYVSVNKNGIIDLEELKSAIRSNTVLISVMMANNEIGTIQPIKEIVGIAKEHDIYVHTDAVQALGKIPVDVKELGVDFLSISGHKVYAPKGVGALYIKKGVKIDPLVVGGHQERGLRAGTENILGIVAFGKAVEVLNSEMKEINTRVEKLRDKLRDGIVEKIPNVIVNGDQSKLLPNTVNITFEKIEGESILLALDLEGVAVSTGSACSTDSLEPSHVIKALGVPDEHAHGSIRFSLGRQNTEEEVDVVLEKLPSIVERLRRMSSVK